MVQDGCSPASQPGELFVLLYYIFHYVRSEDSKRSARWHTPWGVDDESYLLVCAGDPYAFLPNEIVNFYGYAESTSKFGSGLFLLVQVVLLLDVVHGWNDKWVGYDEQFWYAALLVVSLVCYLATFASSGLLFHFFTSGEDCSLNMFFMVFTLILVFVFVVVALHLKLKTYIHSALAFL